MSAPRPHPLRTGVDVAAPVEVVWTELIDLDRWPKWGPSVRAARLDGGARVLHEGAAGAVRPAPGVWLPFVVTGWEVGADHRSWAWRVAGVPATDHTVVALGEDRCRVEMGVPWWAPGYLAVIAVALRHIRERAEV